MSRGSRGHEYLTEPELRAWSGCLVFTDRVVRALDDALSRSHGLSVKEFDVLITLYNAPDARLRMSDLADRVVLSPAGVTHLVTRLERDGLVSRSVDENDRRSFLATLTPAGDRRLRESRPTHNEVIRSELTHRLTKTQLKTLGSLWEVVNAGVERDSP